jgi:chemotaxis protein MotB
MREVLGARDDIRIVGDRFVFQSEVLFDVGSAALGEAGQRELARLADAIREVLPEIPREIDWVLRVDGHTDLTGSLDFNWELSQRRALSVVRYLSEEQNLPADRLAAAGFGPFQPLDRGTGPEALARNRRIEVKFTER